MLCTEWQNVETNQNHHILSVIPQDIWLLNSPIYSAVINLYYMFGFYSLSGHFSDNLWMS